MEEKAPGLLQTILRDHWPPVEPLLARRLPPAVAAAVRAARGKALRRRPPPPLPGVMATVHTFGRDLTFHVHVHVLCTEGGLRADQVWQPVNLFPIAQYRKLWQYSLLTGLRRKLKGNRGAQRLVGRLFRRYPRGFI